MGFRLWPSSVREYSTLGGTSAYTLRLISPLSSISRSCAVNTFCDTLPMDFFSSPKRFVPGSKSRRISTFHLSPMSVKVVSPGQAGNSFFTVCHAILPASKYIKSANRFLAVTTALYCAYFTICLYRYIISLCPIIVKAGKRKQEKNTTHYRELQIAFTLANG